MGVRTGENDRLDLTYVEITRSILGGFNVEVARKSGVKINAKVSVVEKVETYPITRETKQLVSTFLSRLSRV